MIDRLASLVYNRRRLVVIVAALAFAVAGAVGSSVADKLDPYGAEDPDKESVIANERLEDAGFRDAGVIVLIEDAPPAEPAGRERIERVMERVEEDPDVQGAVGYLETGSPDFISRDGQSTYLAVRLAPTGDKESQDAAARIAEEAGSMNGVSVGGLALVQEQINDQVESDLKRAELFAFPILFLLSLLFFRGLIAASLPLLVGGLAIVGTFFGLRLATEFGSISIFALNLTTGLGLGLAIDYSLFVVSRYREEIAKHGPGLEAMRRTMATAGRTVLYSALTVAAALAALLVFPQRFLYSMGLGGSMVALLAALISLTVLPAVLALLGNRVNALSPRFLQRRAERDASATEEGFWYRLSQTVQRVPGRIALVSATLLIVLGLPFLTIKFTYVDEQILPEELSSHQVGDVLRTEFPPFRDTPIRFLVEGGDEAKVARLTEEVGATKGIAAVNPPQELENGDVVVDAISKTSYIADESMSAVDRIRELPSVEDPAVMLTGGTAFFQDFQDSLAEHLPLAVAIIVLSTLIVLFLMTGSVVLPVKQLLMNFLNLSAVFGILVFIFQDGRLEGFLDYSSQGALEQTMPILLFAVAFGLSTDYGVFLLSRIKESRDQGASDGDAVAIGLERTGRIVTAAALMFGFTALAFATSEIIFIKQNFLGTALAVFIDALVIRALLVPSLMELLGHWNWWAPKPLRWLHHKIGLSHGEPDTA